MNRCENCRYSVTVRNPAGVLRLSCIMEPYGQDNVEPDFSCPRWHLDTEPRDEPPPNEPWQPHVTARHTDAIRGQDEEYEDPHSLGEV